MEQFDLIIIGGGPGGYTAAIRAAQDGMKVALVERRTLGGTCLNRGCIPTKALLHAASLYREILEGETFGIFAEAPRYDMKKMHERKDDVVTQLRDGVVMLLRAHGVSFYDGHGTLHGDGVVIVDGEPPITLHADKILLAVGAGPAKPDIPGLEYAIYSDDLLEGAPRDLKSLIVVGGGVIGLEMAAIYRNLGCHVEVIARYDRILPRMDKEIAQNLSMILKKRGVIIHTGADVEEITETETGVAVHFSTKAGGRSAEAEAVLMATGRSVSIEDLLADGLTLETNQGILVNDRFETSMPGVWAIGDCLPGKLKLAHVAAAEATNAVAIMQGKEPEVRLDAVPNCIHTEPEIATVGLSADEAKAEGITVKTGKFLMSANGKSLIDNQERGFIKLVFNAETEVIVGAQLMCGRATELINELSHAIIAGRTARELASVIRPHPSYGEAVTEAADDFFDTAVHIMPKRKRK